jgi:hypothetical protein
MVSAVIRPQSNCPATYMILIRSQRSQLGVSPVLSAGVRVDDQTWSGAGRRRWRPLIHSISEQNRMEVRMLWCLVNRCDVRVQSPRRFNDGSASTCEILRLRQGAIGVQ